MNSPLLRAIAILRRRSHLVKVKEDVDEQEQKRVDAEKIREEQRVKLVEKVKDRQIIEKNKANSKEDWKAMMNLEETKFMDDIATSSFNRKAIG